ncbi:hypothetical protein CcrBL47_gp488 [Caulobacter phage BL47]|nr:hypothetical protein CcrBL47_gp488 [Caulobacter phage BL47]UTU10326.1 hypothetical protein CcrRB23_gp464 [Caulobacter phage RB23]
MNQTAETMARAEYERLAAMDMFKSNPMPAWESLPESQRGAWIRQAAEKIERERPQVLSPLDRDIVDLLQEESAEVLEELTPHMAAAIARIVKLANKAKRFGNVKNPFEGEDTKPNYEKLEDEIGDFGALVAILCARGVLSKTRINERIEWKVGMLNTHGSIDWTKDDQPAAVPEDPAVVQARYEDKAAYQEMILRKALTGQSAPHEGVWVEALRRLNDFLAEDTPPLSTALDLIGLRNNFLANRDYSEIDLFEQAVVMLLAKLKDTHPGNILDPAGA